MELTKQANVTPTHEFLNYLNDQGKLLRVYTQNIDDLDERAGLKCGFEKDDRVVQLHGDLNTCKCTLCSFKTETTSEIQMKFKDGKPPVCPNCEANAQSRIENGKRAIKVGMLRPNIVLYNEHHATGDLISKIQNGDMRKGPDMLIVMGTSLQIPGVKHILKKFAALVKEKGGLTILINKTRTKEFESVFDHQFQGSCDEVCELLRCGVEKLINEEFVKKQEKESKRIAKIAKEKREADAVSKTPISKFFPVVKPVSEVKPNRDLIDGTINCNKLKT